MRRTIWLGIFGLILLSAMPRVMGVYDDFWLDEIWSQRIARQIRSPLDVIRLPAALTDNNHPLNTLWMWSIGNHPHWRIYRGPAVIAGIACVVLTAVLMRRRGMVAALVATVLVGLSYPMIAFSSEARGYALAIFFALLALEAMERFLARPGWVAIVIFWFACLLGLLSHLTFALFYAGVLVWSVYRLIRMKRSAVEAVAQIARCHVIPVAGVVAIYLGFARKLQILGAPPQPPVQAVRDAVGALLGAGDSTIAAIALICAAAVLFVLSLWTMSRHGSDWWILLLGVTVVAPALIVIGQILLVEQRQPIAPRYFLIPYIFFLLSLSVLLSDWLGKGAIWRCAACAVLVGFLAINLWHTMLFLRWGRGDYLEAIAHMSRHTPARQIVVLSDDPMRTEFVLRYYDTFLPPPQQLIIYDGSSTPPQTPPQGPPLWIIVHSNRRGQPPVPAFNEYLLDREFTYYGFSGYSWYVYRHRVLWPQTPGVARGQPIS